MSTTTPLRVLLVCHGLPPESVGGVEQHVDGLARALAARGCTVHAYARTGRQDLAAGSLVDEPVGDPAERPYAVTRVAYRHEGLDALQDLYRRELLDRAFARFLDGRSFDVAHVHHLTGVSTGVLDVLAARSIPRVLTLHDYWLMCPRGQMWHRDGTVTEVVDPERCADCLRPAYGRLVPDGAAGIAALAELHEHARAVLAKADALVVPSARAVPPFVGLGVDQRRFVVVENGVDTDALATLDPPDPAPDRPLRIGYLGTLIPSKGLDVLVRAFRRLPGGLAALRIHGNAVPYHGDETFLTRVFSLLAPGDDAIWGGPYRTADLPRLLAGIDLLVAPALWREAFGLTVREALAAGRPVVVSRIGGLQDAVEDGVAGRLFEPGDDRALAGILRGLAEDREAFARLVAGTRSAGPVRGFDAMAADLSAVYDSVRA